MTHTKPLRAALYVRVSTSDQNPQLQLDALRDLAERRGWVISGEYIDEGISGSKDRRPELDRLMRDAVKARMDVVICWRFDRFARSVRHLVMALDEFRAKGIDFLSVNDGIDTSTPAGRFTFHVIAAVAELERELIRERTKAGMAAARKRGAKIGRPRVDFDLVKAERLRAKGVSIRKIAATLKVSSATVHRGLSAGTEGNGSVTTRTADPAPVISVP